MRAPARTAQVGILREVEPDKEPDGWREPDQGGVGHEQSAPQAAAPVQLAHPGGSQSSVGATIPSPHRNSPGVPFLLQLSRQLVATLLQSVRPAAYMILAAAMHRRFPSPVHAVRCVLNATWNGTLHTCPRTLHCFVQGLA
jgi:hypothetical protein